MMSLPEMGTAVMNGINVVFLVLNNQGYMSIRGGSANSWAATSPPSSTITPAMARPIRPISRLLPEGLRPSGLEGREERGISKAA
jgi:hypothetical protein